ncbi:DEKNAAC104960 [Brettanomyces naardenensis]|uniref:DEKNAAC104960 n=1 Tax=Brettanomyces naardenensis TaxID=13370 RepID=A0A448YS69_BRENA|nr:DEKNAAC104960 [Brettanomyces naardenensis]
MNKETSGGEGESTFTLEPVQLQFQIVSDIGKLLVRNNLLYLILENGLVHRINLDNPEKVDKIVIDLGPNKVKNAYLDRKGYHLIVQSIKDDFYYINYQSTTSKELTKMRSFPVTSISFLERHVHKNTTGPMIVSMVTGSIYEVNIDSKKEKLIKQIWKSRDGIMYVCNSQTTKGNSIIYRVLCGLTNNKIVQFSCELPLTVSSSSSSLQSSFKRDPISFNFNSLIHMTSNSAAVAFLDVSEEDSSYQISYGSISFKSKKELDHLKLDAATGSTVASIMLTRYYILVLTTKNEFLVFNQLNGREVSRQNLSSTGQKFVDFTSDLLIETYWLYSPASIYEIVIDNENSGIWRLMMERNMFDQALSTLKSPHGSDSVKYDTIVVNKGRYLLRKGNYEKAAKILADSSVPFEEISLKFLELKELKSLRIYLINKLRSLPKSLYMQSVIISSWLVELYVEGLNQLGAAAAAGSVLDSASPDVDQKAAEDKEKLLEVFHSFLDEFKDSLDKEAVYQILLSHNRKEELLYFASLINDYNFVLKYYLNLHKWEESLKVLSLQADSNLVYRYSTLLFVNYPVKTCDTWIRLIDGLQYLKLLPALLTYNKTVARARRIDPDHNQALRFLRFLIKEGKVRDRIVHNSLLSILISYPNTQNEDLIMKYLENQHKSKALFENGAEDFEILFDPDYILRLCFKYRRTQSAIYIYSMMGNYEEAVDLALQNDLIEVAVVVTDKPSNSSVQERKKLWLKISAKLIQKVVADESYLDEHTELLLLTESNDDDDSGKNKVRYLLKFLMSKCEYLSMKDLLPLFPDFWVIDNFKEEVVKSLQDLSAEMNHLSGQMTDSISQSDKINREIKEFKKVNFQIIEPYESCMICHKILTTRKFIIFPCYHSFHQDCLVKQILESNDYKLKSEIYKLQKKIVASSGDKESLNLLKADIDHLLSQKCCLCTDMKINEIEQPLVRPGDQEEIEWAI